MSLKFKNKVRSSEDILITRKGMHSFPYEMLGQGAVSRHVEQCMCSRLSVQRVACYCSASVNSNSD